MTMYNDFLQRRWAFEVNSDGIPLREFEGRPARLLENRQVAAIESAAQQTALDEKISILNTLPNPSFPVITVQPADITDKQVQTSNSLQVNLQIMPEGFGSYLQDILPKDIATAAGAFSATMQQIKNIKNIPFEKFAQVAATLETTRGLNLVNGTNVPTDITEAADALKLIALGSGPYGTYTFSDFFGCMSGLPYPWTQIQPAIIGLQSTTLTTIYQQLFLAASWKQATLVVKPTYTTTSSGPDGYGIYTYSYQITGIPGIDSFDIGGGYGRGGAVAPTGTFNDGSGATITTRIDTNPANVATTYGRILGALLNSPGTTVAYGTGTSATPPPPPATLTVTVTEPPTTYGGSGWPAMNTAVQHYIDEANNEIAIIRSTHPGQAAELNDMWDNLGTQLVIEQKARNLAYTQTPLPNDPTGNRIAELFPYPTMIYSFTDLIPTYAKATQPNMSVQTLEAISDLDKNAGQSVVAMMRAERNKARLLEAGITMDDIIPDSITPAEEIALIVNGTIANSAPAFPFNTEPAGYYDPETQNFLVTNVPVIPDNAAIPFDTTNPTDPITNPSPNTINVQPTILGAPSPSVAAVLGIGTPNNVPIATGDIGIGSLGISPETTGVGAAIAPAFFAGPGAGGGLGGQGGGPIVPGSLAGSPYTKLIPPALNPIYTSAVLLPASLPVQAAIEEVIRCNCDCWIQ